MFHTWTQESYRQLSWGYLRSKLCVIYLFIYYYFVFILKWCHIIYIIIYIIIIYIIILYIIVIIPEGSCYFPIKVIIVENQLVKWMATTLCLKVCFVLITVLKVTFDGNVMVISIGNAEPQCTLKEYCVCVLLCSIKHIELWILFHFPKKICILKLIFLN